MVVDSVMGSIYSADPGVDRHHLISISSYHTMKIHTLSFTPFGPTHSVQNVHLRNCLDRQRQAISNLFTRLRRTSNQNLSPLSIPFGYLERCGGVLIVGSLHSGSIVLPQWPPNGVSLRTVNGRVQLLLR
jgi:hypothetical protein